MNNTTTDAKLAPKQDFFDALGAWIKYPIAMISGIYTGKFLAEFLDMSTLDGFFIMATLPVIITVMEILLVRRAVKKQDRTAMFMAFLVATLSIGGSLAYFQINLKQNIIYSNEYQMQLQQVRIWQNQAANPEKYPQTYAWAARKAEEAMKQLKEIEHNGAGAGVEAYRWIAELFDVPLDKVATWINIFIAIIVEGLLIYSVRMEMEQALEEKPVESADGDNPEDEDELFEQMLSEINNKAKIPNNNATKPGAVPNYAGVNPFRR